MNDTILIPEWVLNVALYGGIVVCCMILRDVLWEEFKSIWRTFNS